MRILKNKVYQIKQIYFILFVIIILILLTNSAYADEIKVTKETSSNIKLYDIIEIKINILNPYSTEKTFEVSERLPNNIELISPEKPDEIKKYNGIEAEFVKWNLIISPNKISTISYKVKISSLGDYSIQPTTLKDTSNNKVYFSNSIEFNVKCDPNNKCEDPENYLNCPEDCSASISDGICNYLSDNTCDPDCIEDPDCKKINSLTIIIITFILAVVIFIIYLLTKKKNI